MNLPEIHEFLGCRTPDGWIAAALALVGECERDEARVVSLKLPPPAELGRMC